VRVSQQDVIEWLALLPIVLAAFRVVTIGDRLVAATVQGRQGGLNSAQNSLLLAGLVFVGLVLAGIGGDAEPLTMGLLLIAFGALAISSYLLTGFRDKVWQGFLGAGFQEAGLYWLVLSVGSLMIDTGYTEDGTESQAAVWAIITLFSVFLIVGTVNRMARDVR
jgi:hypothetical protein